MALFINDMTIPANQQTILAIFNAGAGVSGIWQNARWDFRAAKAESETLNADSRAVERKRRGRRSDLEFAERAICRGEWSVPKTAMGTRLYKYSA